jgi:acyl transferase domain-containing protein
MSQATGARPLLPQLLTLSAPSPVALEEATENLIGDLAHCPAADLARRARALQAEGPAHRFRRVVVASEPGEAAHYLRERDPRRTFSTRMSPARPVVFLFSGVGEQYAGMTAGLHRYIPVFARELDRCLRGLGAEIGTDLHAILFPDADAAEPRSDLAVFGQSESIQEIHRTIIAQPLMFAVQYAMAAALRSMGIEPAALLGYSIGEYAAACVADVFPLDSALSLVARRARLVDGLPGGSMLAVMSDVGPLEPLLGALVSVAALDGPELTILAGPDEDLTRIAERLDGEGIACRPLPASHAFHSTMMEPVVAPLRDLIDTFRLQPPAVPMLSNVTGTWMRPEDATSPDYWASHLRRTVRFADDTTEVWKLSAPVLIELGPGQALTRLALRSPGRPGGDAALTVSTIPGRLESRPGLVVFLNAVGRLWATGAEIKFDQLPRS